MVDDLRIGTFVLDVDHLAFSQVQLIDDRSGVFVRNGTDDFLNRFVQLAVDGLEDDLRPADSDFIALSAHVFQQDGEMELSSSGNAEGIGRPGSFHLETDVGLQFPLQTLLDVAAGDVLAGTSLERRSVDHEVHGQGRLFDIDLRKWIIDPFRSDRIADLDILDPADHDDVSALCLTYSRALETLVVVQVRDLAVFLFIIVVADGNHFVLPDDAGVDSSHADPADVVVVGQCADLHLQRLIHQIGIRFHMGNDGLEQRIDVVVGITRIVSDDAVSGDAVEDREIQLIVVGTQIQEQIVDFVDDFVDPGILLVDLVDEKDRTQSGFQRLLQYETSLRHRTLGRVHQQDDRIDGLDDPFHFAGEIRVSRSIHDVDLVVLIDDRTVLGIDRDPSFPLQIVGIHDLGDDLLMIGKDVGLRQKSIDQSRFSRINMGDHRHVYNLFEIHTRLF